MTHSTTPPRSLLLLITAFAAVIALGAAITLAQPDSPANATETAPDQPSATTQSFASAFFVSRSTTIGPDGQETTQIQWIGSLLIWGLMGLSIVSFGLIGSIAWSHRRGAILPGETVDAVRGTLDREQYAEALKLTQEEPSYFSALIHASLSEAPHGYPTMVRTLEQTLDAETTRRLRVIEPLNVIGSVSPMIGLFGTVYGMILAFQAIVAAGGTPSPKLLAAGIGTALTTTFWGLVVAIPALSAYALLRNRLDALAAEANVAAEELIARFRPSRRPTTTAASPRT
jgi:biopolymer transport protein ExbB